MSMDILDVVDQMIDAFGLVGAKGRIDASLFRSVGARTNLGLINAENLSIQIHVNPVTPNGPAAGEPKLENPRIPTLQAGRPRTERAAADRETSTAPGTNGPRVVDRHLFDVRSTFRFDPGFVFEEKKITVNTVPIYFVRKGGRIRCDITINNATLCDEVFSVRDGELCMLEGAFSRCGQQAPNAVGLNHYDTRLTRLVSRKSGHLHRNGGLFICVFPTAPRRTLPLGRDDGVFPADGFGPAALICVGKSSRGNRASYRVCSHFFVVSDNDDRG